MFWPRDLLGEDLRNTRIISWGYDSNSSQDTIIGHAETLLADINLLRSNSQVQSLSYSEFMSYFDGLYMAKNRPIIFVGHCIGGIIIVQVSVPIDKHRIGGSLLYQALNRAHTYYTTQRRDQGLVYKNTIGVVSARGTQPEHPFMN